MANSTAEFDCAALVRKLRPLIEPTMSTPGVACRISRTFLAAASVRSSEAPSGQLDHDEEIALVLDRQEGRRNALPDQKVVAQARGEEDEHRPANADEQRTARA